MWHTLPLVPLMQAQEQIGDQSYGLLLYGYMQNILFAKKRVGSKFLALRVKEDYTEALSWITQIF